MPSFITYIILNIVAILKLKNKVSHGHNDTKSRI